MIIHSFIFLSVGTMGILSHNKCFLILDLYKINCYYILMLKFEMKMKFFLKKVQ